MNAQLLSKVDIKEDLVHFITPGADSKPLSNANVSPRGHSRSDASLIARDQFASLADNEPVKRLSLCDRITNAVTPAAAKCTRIAMGFFGIALAMASGTVLYFYPRTTNALLGTSACVTLGAGVQTACEALIPVLWSERALVGTNQVIKDNFFTLFWGLTQIYLQLDPKSYWADIILNGICSLTGNLTIIRLNEVSQMTLTDTESAGEPAPLNEHDICPLLFEPTDKSYHYLIVETALKVSIGITAHFFKKNYAFLELLEAFMFTDASGNAMGTLMNKYKVLSKPTSSSYLKKFRLLFKLSMIFWNLSWGGWLALSKTPEVYALGGLMSGLDNALRKHQFTNISLMNDDSARFPKLVTARRKINEFVLGGFGAWFGANWVQSKTSSQHIALGVSITTFYATRYAQDWLNHNFEWGKSKSWINSLQYRLQVNNRWAAEWYTFTENFMRMGSEELANAGVLTSVTANLFGWFPYILIFGANSKSLKPSIPDASNALLARLIFVEANK